MGDLTTTSSSVPQRSAPAGRCEYCGAPLVPEFYFCLRCATPHRSVESVLPASYVARPTAEQLIQRKAPHVWPMFFTFMGVLLGVGIPCHLAFGEESPELSLIVQTAALSIVTFIYAAIHWASLAVQLKRFGFFHWAAWAGLGLLAAVLAFLVSAVFVDYRTLWNRLRKGVTPFEPADVAVEGGPFAKHLTVSVKEIRSMPRALVLEVRRTAAFPRTDAALAAMAKSDANSLPGRLAVEAIARGYVRCESFDKKGQFMGFAMLRVASLREKETVEAVLPIPRDRRPAKLVLGP